MEGLERRRHVDLLNEDLEVTFQVSSDALAHLPVVSKEDVHTGRERFRYLLGRVEDRGVSAHISIDAVVEDEISEQEHYGTYAEGIEEVLLSPTRIRDRAHELASTIPMLSGLRFVGDVHTHPDRGSSYPSRQDLEQMVRQYTSGDFEAKEPYIFGIASLANEGGEMEYNFYRVVRTNSGTGYGFKILDYRTR